VRLFSESGGLAYHARALRYRDRAWAPFRAALRAWLVPRLPMSTTLMLVGPSAGHCLPLDSFDRYASVVVLEPDWLARRLLLARLRAPRLQFISEDLLLRPLLEGRDGLEVLLDRQPTAGVLFCNVLGQLHFDLDRAAREQFRAAFATRIWPRLQGREWVSFHDRWSLDEGFPAPVADSLSFGELPSDEELGSALFGSGEPLVVRAHEASELFPRAWPRHYFTWRLAPGALHVIEALGSRDAGA
jgi:hypothetical protein